MLIDALFALPGKVLIWLLARPAVLAVVAALGLIGWSVGPIPAAVVLSAGIVALVGWRLAWPASFVRYVSGPWRRAHRRHWYRRRWPDLMALCHLTDRLDGQTLVPVLRRLVVRDHVDRLEVVILPGQSPEDWSRRGDALAHALGAPACRIRTTQPGRVVLDVQHSDPLAEPVLPSATPDTVDLHAVPLGRTETGAPWTIRLTGRHLLLAGCTGSGKSGVLWALLRALGPAIRDRLVVVWALDPKGGMELAPGAALFTRIADDDPAGMADLLEDAVDLMRQRAARLKGTTRTHRVSAADPLVLVVVDELAAVVAYAADREVRRRAAQALSMLLTQGRAVGVLVIAAVQDPRKEILPFRDLFPTRIALRLVEDLAVDMVLGRGARDRGALCDQISPFQPGVGYVVLDGQAEPVRVRAAWVDDAEIAVMAIAHQPASAAVLTDPGPSVAEP